jgi:hypothetical protein
VVGDQHRLPDLQALPYPAGGVGQHDGPAPGRMGGTDPVHHGGRRMALVAVHPPDERQHPSPAGRLQRAHGAAVTGDGGHREAGQGGRLHLGHSGPQPIDGRPPTGPEHHRDVVAVDAGRVGQGGRRLARQGERIGGHRGGGRGAGEHGALMAREP